MDVEKIITELSYKAVRSSGAGGQNVNKVASKVVLTFNLRCSNALNLEQKARLEIKLAHRLTSDFNLILNCDEDRSQLKNKAIVTKRFLNLIKNSLQVPKIRKVTKIPKSVIRKRLNDKKNTAKIKANRKRPDLE
ncbi:alternative ribosome rescue aminoacyl-tRNA hydrolase ArfB [Flavobacterium crassostreae]|uniref:Peptide chain release factor 1 n=1 Tax=Flavobacterium crassostreae TaxID=1763534 RepID=A0A1B9E4L9_9FLAO|nr:alternative ribosome rescue aminoacyl-tRNA hydrolase ArfB [Flavobacterium crassostreae]OCB76881.1 peptide chain release factor 1 [Flavobacterium crassostreae]